MRTPHIVGAMAALALISFVATLGVATFDAGARQRDDPRTVFCDNQLKRCIAPCKRMHSRDDRNSCYTACENQVMECMSRRAT